MDTIPTSDTPGKIELSWDQFIDGDFPTAPERLASATDLVLSGGVTPHADGTATVKNDSRTYEITDACSCADAQHRSKWCKHVLAVVLWKRATACLAQKNGHLSKQEHRVSDDPPTYGEAPPAASPPPLCGRRASALPLPEAPYSLTVTALSPPASAGATDTCPHQGFKENNGWPNRA